MSIRAIAAFITLTLFAFAMPAFAAKSGAEQMREFELAQMKAAVANYRLPFQAAPGQALVVVVRPNNGGGLVRFNVFVDSKDDSAEVGYTRSEQYIYFSLTPGSHKIYSKAENWAETQLSVNAGDVVFIKQVPNFGMFMASNSLELIDETEGKYHVKRLAKGEMLKTGDVIASESPSAQPQQVVPSAASTPNDSSTSDIAQKLRKLQSLRNEGLLSEAEYKAKKMQLLEKL